MANEKQSPLCRYRNHLQTCGISQNLITCEEDSVCPWSGERGCVLQNYQCDENHIHNGRRHTNVCGSGHKNQAVSSHARRWHCGVFLLRIQTEQNPRGPVISASLILYGLRRRLDGNGIANLFHAASAKRYQWTGANAFVALVAQYSRLMFCKDYEI